MKRRLYFLLPDVSSARRLVDDLLLARIEATRIHVLGPRGADLRDLPEANVLQKTDLVHGAQTGAILGAVLGALGGLFYILVPPHSTSSFLPILLGSLFGGFFGLWVASLVGAGVPNSRLKQFRASIDRGLLLVMVDVPRHDTHRIADLVVDHHPQAISAGSEPTIPAFP